MKILVLSDIHSNIYALNAIWEREKDADLIVVAGDLVDYGPFPREVIRWCKMHKVLCVQGNHDREVIAKYRIYGKNTDCLPPQEYMWVHENCRYLEEEEVSYLEGLPETLWFEADGYRYLVSHMYGPGRDRPGCIGLFDDFCRQNFVVSSDLPVRLILGHSHRQAVVCLRDNRLWVNPGSVSYRREDDFEKEALYAVIENGEIDLRAVGYDRKPLLQYTLEVAKNGRMQEAELKVAFFFFGSSPAPSEQKGLAENMRIAQEDLKNTKKREDSFNEN